MLNTVTALKNNQIDTIAIGGFDGMHIAHQRLFSQLGENGAIVVIETGYANLTPSTERERYAHHKIIYFNLEDIRHLSGEEFVALLKKSFIGLKKIVVGYDFHFGKERKYNFDSLKTMFDGEVQVVDEVMLHNESVHSHKIRAFLEEGNLAKANQFLAHNYTIKGDVIKGQGLGSSELVATINLTCKGYLLPKNGVYATLTQIDNEEHFHPSISFIGHRSSTDNKFAIETHILDKTLTCKEGARISFLGFIRENRHFDSLAQLKEQILFDITDAKKRHFKVSL